MRQGGRACVPAAWNGPALSRTCAIASTSAAAVCASVAPSGAPVQAEHATACNERSAMLRDRPTAPPAAARYAARELPSARGCSALNQRIVSAHTACAGGSQPAARSSLRSIRWSKLRASSCGIHAHARTERTCKQSAQARAKARAHEHTHTRGHATRAGRAGCGHTWGRPMD